MLLLGSKDEKAIPALISIDSHLPKVNRYLQEWPLNNILDRHFLFSF